MIAHRKNLVSEILCLVVGFGVAPAFAKAPAAPTVPRAISKFIALGEIPGAVTLVHDGDSPATTTALGLSDLKSTTMMQPDSLFGIMSMTKPITATAFMILVDEGKVSIDDPVEKYISAFRDAKLANGEPVRDLKIRHLLTHTSGLNGSQQCVESLAGTANLVAARPFHFQPGEKWEYSPAMNVVGRIIEIVSGQSYEEFLRERIFEPLAMNDTSFRPSAEDRSRIVALYKKSKGGKSLELADRWNDANGPEVVPNPSAGLFTTAADLDRFYQMILGGGELDGKRIVSKESVRQMTSVQTGDLVTGFTPGNGWGLGWCVVRQPQNVTGMLSPGPFGHGGAYGTEAWVDPVKRRVYLLMIQRADLGNTDASDIRKEFQQAAADELD